MENLYDNVLSMKKIRLTPEHMLVENNITVNDQDEIAKILTVNSDVVVEKTAEALIGETNISGKVILNVIYLTTSGEINNQTAESPFLFKLKNDQIDTSCKFNICASVEDCDINKVSNNQIKITTTIVFDVVIIKNENKKFLTDVGDNTFCKKDEKVLYSHEKQICDKFEENLTTTVKNGVKKVFLTNVDCLIKDWNLGPNFVSVNCELYARVLYADKNEPAELSLVTLSKSFKQEIEVEGVNSESDIDVSSYIVRDCVNVEIEDGEDTKINVNVPIMVCVNTYLKNKVMMVGDVYSTKDIIEIQNDNFENSKNLKPEYLEGKIEGSVVLSDETPRVDKYICVTNVKTTNNNVYVKNNTLTIDGIVTANVIYLNDEIGEIQSVEIEIPYVIDKKVEINENTFLEPSIFVCDVDAMVKRGREIFFDAKIKAFVSCFETVKDIYTKQLEKTGEINVKDNALEIYFAKAGESVWDIAKSLKIAPDMIVGQNADICDPLEKDQNIAIYFQKV